MSSGERMEPYPERPDGGTDALHDAAAAPRGIEPDEPSDEQIAIYRAMTPQRRLEIAEQMYWSARRWKAAWLRSLHPEWSEAEIEAEVKRLFINARS